MVKLADVVEEVGQGGPGARSYHKSTYTIIPIPPSWGSSSWIPKRTIFGQNATFVGCAISGATQSILLGIALRAVVSERRSLYCTDRAPRIQFCTKRFTLAWSTWSDGNVEITRNPQLKIIRSSWERKGRGTPTRNRTRSRTISLDFDVFGPRLRIACRYRLRAHVCFRCLSHPVAS